MNLFILYLILVCNFGLKLFFGARFLIIIVGLSSHKQQYFQWPIGWFDKVSIPIIEGVNGKRKTNYVF